MAEKFVVKNYHPMIRKFQCIKETAKFVWLDGYYGNGSCRQMAKSNDVFDTWDQAHGELMYRAEMLLNAARKRLQEAQGFAENVRGMKPPTTEAQP